MIDMDILVRKEHLAAVQAILLEWGYVPTKQQSVEMTCTLGAHHLLKEFAILLSPFGRVKTLTFR